MLSRFHRAATRFAKDRRGAAAIEFAFIFGVIMVPAFLCSVDVTELLLADRRTENVASSLADVIARDTTVTPAELTDLHSAIAPLMAPNSVAGLSVRITSFDLSTGAAVVDWSWASGAHAALQEGESASDVPASVITDVGNSVVRAEVWYEYSTPVAFVVPATFSLHHVDYRRPRLADPVPCPQC